MSASKRASEAVWRLLFGGPKDKPIVESPTKSQATALIAAEYAPLTEWIMNRANHRGDCEKTWKDAPYKCTCGLDELRKYIEGDATP